MVSSFIPFVLRIFALILAKIEIMADELSQSSALGLREKSLEVVPAGNAWQEEPRSINNTQTRTEQQPKALSGLCPHCGSQLDSDADFCETCHHYVRDNVCSFCGAKFLPQDAYCPECGSPRGGIVCPTCHTMNDFAFCKQCGTPLTDEARLLVMQMKQKPEYQEMVRLAKEYDALTLENPISSERDKQREEQSIKFREHVLKLLAQDEGVTTPDIPKVEKKRMTKEELQKDKDAKLARLSELLNKMEIPPHPQPAYVRNYAMAQKPAGVRLAWVCNWKHAMHSSPCGCAKPQMGGKWVILGRGSKQEIKDDN